MAQKCKNCAWFCHADGKCYGTPCLLRGWDFGILLPVPADNYNCPDWTFDGLEDWEREETEALMTMEAETMI